MFTIIKNLARYAIIVVLACFSFIYGGPVAAQAPPEPETILRVDGLDGSANGDGSDWQDDAFLYLQDALDHLGTLQTSDFPVAIWVRGGTLTEPVVYRPDQGASVTLNERDETFRMANLVRWYGGFAGDETEQEFNDRLPFERITILSGEIDDPEETNDNTFHVVTAEWVGASAVIDGFVICDGNAVGETSLSQHGTQSCQYVWPLQTGGGLLVRGGSPCACNPNILRCTFESNHAVHGGAVAVNVVGSGGLGPTFWHSTFHDNTSATNGGAVYITAPQVSPGVGAPEFVDNTNFYNCLFYRNDAGGKGGAIHSDVGKTVNVDFCTIADNTATSFGAFSHDDTACSGTVYRLKVSGSIMWGNGTTLIGAVTCVKIKRSCVEGGWTCQGTDPCTGNIFVDPSFENRNADDYRLTCDPRSLCINTAGDTIVKNDDFDLDQNTGTGVAPDLDLNTRVVAAPDMGVYESIGDEVNCLGDLTNDGLVGVPDLLAVINAWGPCPSTPCLADFMPSPQVCGAADLTVGVPDLLGIINNWGPCTGGPGGGGVPFELSDCWNEACDGLTGEDWQFCVDKCIESYCQQYPEDCD